MFVEILFENKGQLSCCRVVDVFKFLRILVRHNSLQRDCYWHVLEPDLGLLSSIRNLNVYNINTL